MMPLALVLGGARSGKSSFAEAVGKILASGDAARSEDVVYFATAVVGEDEEFVERIARHRASRPERWTTLEPPATLGDLVRRVEERPPALVIVDCATLWLAGVLTRDFSRYSSRQLTHHLEAESRHFVETLTALARRGTPVVVVSNEAGSGVVPATAAGRHFRDALGLLNRSLSEAAGLTILLVAGNGLCLKGAEHFASASPLGQTPASEDFAPLHRIGAGAVARLLKGSRP